MTEEAMLRGPRLGSAVVKSSIMAGRDQRSHLGGRDRLGFLVKHDLLNHLAHVAAAIDIGDVR